MRISKSLKPKKVKKIPKRIFDNLTKEEQKQLVKALKNREDLNTPGHKIRFFKH